MTGTNDDGQARAGAWDVFPVVIARSAGLPVTWLEMMGSSLIEETVRVAERAFDDVRHRQQALLDDLHALRKGTSSKAVLRLVRRAIREVTQERCPSELSELLGSPIYERWQTLLVDRDRADQAVAASVLAAYEGEDRILLEVVKDPIFANTVELSNPEFFGSLARLSRVRSRRQSQRTVYAYLQRFAAKADPGGDAGPLNLVQVIPAPVHASSGCVTPLTWLASIFHRFRVARADGLASL